MSIGTLLAVVLEDVARGPVEGEDNDWITENIIRPAGMDGTPKNTSYCGMTVQRWLRLSGMADTDGMASVGKILFNWAPRVGADIRDHLTADRPPRAGDIIIHQDGPNSWHGHVMLAVGSCPDTGRVLVAEGNHSKSMGPSGERYYDGTLGEDLERRQGIGLRWLAMSDDYISYWVTPPPFLVLK